MANTKDTKDFSAAMTIRRSDSALDEMFPETPSQPQQPQPEPQPKQKQKGVGRYANQPLETKDGRKQIAFNLPAKIVDDIRAIAYWEHLEQWVVVADALSDAVKRYEKKNGEIRPIPDKKNRWE